MNKSTGKLSQKSTLYCIPNNMAHASASPEGPFKSNFEKDGQKEGNGEL